MKTFGIIANGVVIPNVTLTTSGTDKDRDQADSICRRKNLSEDGQKEQVLSSVLTKNLRGRIAHQGAEEVRLYPVVA